MSTIQLRTSIPGPKSKALSERRAKAVPRGLSHGTPIYVAKAQDAWLEDVDGNRYLDFAGGIGCLNVGHRREAVVEAVKDQLDRFLHTCVQVTPYESYVRLAERMNEVTPGKFAKKTIFVNSGAEAVENAVKIARAATKRPGIIAFEDAFHGRTMMTLALTSKTHPYKAGFAPFPSEVYRVPFAYCYRCSYSKTYPSCDLYCARHLEDTFKRVVANEEVAAVIAEPVLGEGGFIAPPPDYFKVLIELCHKHGILFIADEVQSGFGRTGALFASERYGIEPDMIVTAKSLGGGLPLAAVTGRAEIMDAPGIGGLGGTFRGKSAFMRGSVGRARPCSSARTCWRGRTNWAITFSAGRASGSAAGASSAMSADWVACRRWNWYGRRRARLPRQTKRKRFRNTATSTA